MASVSLQPKPQSKTSLEKTIARRTAAIMRSWDSTELAERAEAGSRGRQELAKLLFGSALIRPQDASTSC